MEGSNKMNRLIGQYKGELPGPLLICFGGMHGNEPAGVKALEKMFEMLEKEPESNPGFVFSGSIVGMIGNLSAYQIGKRFIDCDLNRQWTDDNVKRIMNSEKRSLKNEALQIFEILTIVDQSIKEYQPSKIVVLDLHTTSSQGGIFSIPSGDQESLKIALGLHAPVITGMLEGIKGTTLHYFNQRNFDIPITAVTFESGQHNEELSIHRAIAGITNCMRTIGNVSADHIENKHDRILIEYSKDLPKVARLVDRHDIKNGDNFEMLPAYANFQKIKKGEILATDRSGAIASSKDGLILMPLYQKQGEDGFFLVQEIDGY